MDLLLPELADVPEGATVELSFRSMWDIEWDWDYGFVLTSTDGETFTSVPSSAGYTTSNAYNPNSAGCLDELDNGLTGNSTAYEQGEPFVTAARNPVAPDYSGDHPFLTDTYDISSLAGQEGARVRLSYFTDPAFDRPGWFVDDLVVTVDGEEIVRVDGEDDTAGRVLQGGCGDAEAPTGADATVCTAGWTRVDATATTRRTTPTTSSCVTVPGSTTTATASPTAVRSTGRRGSSSSTPTRPTATGTTASRRHPPSTTSTRSPNPAPAATPRPARTRPSRTARVSRTSTTTAPTAAGWTTTPTTGPRTASGTSPTTASASTSPP